MLENLSLKLTPGGRTNSSDLSMDSAKLVCVDSKQVQKENEELEGREKPPELPIHDPLSQVLPKTESDIRTGPEEDLKDEFRS